MKITGKFSKKVFLSLALAAVILWVVGYVGMAYFANTTYQVVLDQAPKGVRAEVTNYWLSDTSELKVIKEYGDTQYIKKIVIDNETNHWGITFSESNADTGKQTDTLSVLTLESGVKMQIIDGEKGGMVPIEMNPRLTILVNDFLEVGSRIVEPIINFRNEIVLNEKHQSVLVKIATSISSDYR